MKVVCEGGTRGVCEEEESRRRRRKVRYSGNVNHDELYRDTGIQGYRDTGVQGYRGS